MKLYTVRRVGWSDYSDFTKRTRRDGQQQLLVISLNDESLQNCDVQFSWEKGLISIITIPSMHLNSDPHNEKISQSWPLHWKRKGASRKWVYYLLNYTKYSLKASFLNGAFFWHIYRGHAQTTWTVFFTFLTPRSPPHRQTWTFQWPP